MTEVVKTEDFEKWLRNLKDRVGRLQIVARIDRLADGSPGDAKPIGQGLWELRLMFGPGYRVYYLHDGQRVILLLCGGDKATQQRDIERAHRLADEYRNEEGQGHG
ncbi:addiction module protein [Humibacillus sp. DSM 29435]|nr:addiction module protein [Humibacillus sp. DSM 29435]